MRRCFASVLREGLSNCYFEKVVKLDKGEVGKRSRPVGRRCVPESVSASKD